MENVAFSHEKRRFGVSDRSVYYEKCRFSSAAMRGMDPVNQPPSGQYEAQNGNHLALDHQTKSTMKIVALNHEKCRYCPLSLGNQERKESYLKKEQYEEERSSSDFIYSSEESDSHNYPLEVSSRFQTQTLRLLVGGTL